jgi:hypothetical protein
MRTWIPGTLAQREQEVIESALEHFQGNKTQAARALGIAERTLYNKIDEYKKSREDQDARDKALEQREKDLQRRARGLPTGQPNGGHAEAGVRVQPPLEIGQKQPVPVREPEKVQGVSPKQAVSSGNGKRG